MPSSPSGGSFDSNWYDSEWNVITTLSVEDTVLYARSVYTISYTIKGNVSTNITDSYHNISGKKSSYSNSFTVLEDQVITSQRSDNNHTLTIFVDGAVKTQFTVEDTKVWFVPVTCSFKDDCVYPDGVVSGNASYTFNY